MYKFINNLFDNCVEIVIICLGISLIIFAYQLGSYFFDKTEEACFEYYKSNNYILDSCEKYRDKLEAINEENN